MKHENQADGSGHGQMGRWPEARSQSRDRR